MSISRNLKNQLLLNFKKTTFEAIHPKYRKFPYNQSFAFLEDQDVKIYINLHPRFENNQIKCAMVDKNVVETCISPMKKIFKVSTMSPKISLIMDTKVLSLSNVPFNVQLFVAIREDMEIMHETVHKLEIGGNNKFSNNVDKSISEKYINLYLYIHVPFLEFY